MEWMYNSSGKSDPEEYLLGKPIDRGHFKEPSPDNFMRSIKTESASLPSQVELSRRLKEDPLTVIREKELEKRKLLWKKSQIKSSDPKVVAVQNTDIDQADTESKSIHQLIIENLRQFPFKIDLEEFYDRLKKKKKEKKLRKKRDDSPHGSRSPRQVSRSPRQVSRSLRPVSRSSRRSPQQVSRSARRSPRHVSRSRQVNRSSHRVSRSPRQVGRSSRQVSRPSHQVTRSPGERYDVKKKYCSKNKT